MEGKILKVKQWLESRKIQFHVLRQDNDALIRTVKRIKDGQWYEINLRLFKNKKVYIIWNFSWDLVNVACDIYPITSTNFDYEDKIETIIIPINDL